MVADSTHRVRQADARSFLEGSEHCHEYLRNEQMWFGTSTVPVGATGDLDPGHAQSWEVFYCAAGHALIDVGTEAFELHSGDSLNMSPGVPHRITNVGTVPVVIVWAGAPGEPTT